MTKFLENCHISDLINKLSCKNEKYRVHYLPHLYNYNYFGKGFLNSQVTV